MAKTTFNVSNNNPWYRYPSGSGQWINIGNFGGVIDQGTIDPSDDVYVAAKGSMANNRGEPGLFMWIDQDFDVDGDVSVEGSDAYLLSQYLLTHGFLWLPNNPDYNTVAPFLKDGVTSNPDCDNSGNPLLVTARTVQLGGAAELDRAATAQGENCLHFTINSTVVDNGGGEG